MDLRTVICIGFALIVAKASLAQEIDSRALEAHARTATSSSSESLRKITLEKRLHLNPCFQSHTFKCAEDFAPDGDDKGGIRPVKREATQNQTQEKPRPRFYKDKAFMTSSLLVYAAAGFDMHETMREKWLYSHDPPLVLGTQRFRDGDVFARPVVNLPNPAFLTTGFAMATGLNWISWKMKNSRRFRHVWWVPQATAVFYNMRGGMSCELQVNRFHTR